MGTKAPPIKFLYYPISDFNPVNKAAALRQRIQKCPAVAFGQHPRIENDDHAGVLFAADQSAKTLFEFEHRLGHLVIEEWASSASFDSLHAGLDDGPIRNRERQLRDDDVGQRFTGHVHSLPKAVHAEQHGVGSGSKALDHLGSRQSVALRE